MLTATVNTDASWCPHTKAGGWAAWISIDGGKRVKRSGTFHSRPKSSAEAELWAALNGAWIAIIQYNVKSVLIQSDCRTALHQVNKQKDESVNLFLKNTPDDVIINTKWVKGHNNDGSNRTYVNNWCDKAAKKHMRRQRRNKRYLRLP